jgi:N-acetyl-anhydromuramyl-L-alanine amidase AmpD
MDPTGGPLEHIGLIGHQDVAVTERLDHYELFSWDGLMQGAGRAHARENSRFRFRFHRPT